MGCASSVDEAAKNAQISRDLAEGASKDMQEVKLLLLGPGGSGKTTFRRQFQNLFSLTFEKAKARREVTPRIFQNLNEGLKSACKRMLADGGDFDATTQEALAFFAEAQDKSSISALGDVHVQHMRKLWTNAAFKELWDSKRSELHIQECASSYLASAVGSYPQWGGKDWVPSVEDCVRCRIRSTGITEVSFKQDAVNFHVFDAGGQRAERRKWIHCFDGVTAVIFVAALTSYAEVLFEDHHKNNLRESIELYGEIANLRAFRQIPVLLFLNKQDLFAQKLVDQKIPLNVSGQFPDAPQTFDFDEGVEWISSQFSKAVPNRKAALTHTHISCAVDSSNVKSLFKSLKEVALASILEDDGFLM